jgi:hypothetical protein
MNKNELQHRSKDFSHRCVKLCMVLPKTILGKHIQGQLIRSSTSVAANYRAACIAQTKAGFISKLSIVIEDAKNQGKKIGVFPVDDDNWIDIGQWAEYKKVMNKF